MDFKNGDLIIYHGTGMLAKAIQYFDNAYWNHIGIISIENPLEIMTLDMWGNGLNYIPLQKRLDNYKNNYCILRPHVSDLTKETAIQSIINDWKTRDIKYDNFLLLRIAIIKKTGIDITGLGKKSKYICSELAQQYCNGLGLETYKEIKLITPQDFINHIDVNFELIK